ncbi:MAG: hypothetical protein ABJA62_12480 [Luteimonas sp.]
MKIMPVFFAFLSCAVLPATALADDILTSRTHVQSAVGLCQGALPSFEGALRKRPLAINNEGTTASFVSCTVDSEAAYAAQQVQDIAILFTNRGAATAVNCTLVDGIATATAGPLAGVGVPEFFPKTLNLAAGTAGGTHGKLGWNLTDKPAGFFLPAVSCLLPPGVEINFVQHIYDQLIPVPTP